MFHGYISWAVASGHWSGISETHPAYLIWTSKTNEILFILSGNQRLEFSTHDILTFAIIFENCFWLLNLRWNAFIQYLFSFLKKVGVFAVKRLWGRYWVSANNFLLLFNGKFVENISQGLTTIQWLFVHIKLWPQAATTQYMTTHEFLFQIEATWEWGAQWGLDQWIMVLYLQSSTN